MKNNIYGIAFKISRIVFFIFLSLISMEVFSQKASVVFKPLNVSAGNAITDVLKEHDWWRNQNRMIQTNLREIDVKTNLDEYINTLKDFGANAVLVNVGGIVANYPTNLPFHYRNPFLENDFVGEVIKRLHAEGIRVIGRFDFSKINETIANNHPDWLSCVDASPMIEANHRVARDNSYEWVSLINLSGQLDKFLQAPVPIGNIPVRIKPGCKVKSVTSLSNGNKLKFDINNDGSINFTIPQLNEWEIILLK